MTLPHLAIAPRTPSGEVASFTDDNQFGWGQSVDKCGYEIVALFWHSVKSGANPYHAADVHLQAHNDYLKFAGPDAVTNHNGMSDQQLYRDLISHNFRYIILPPGDFNRIRTFLLYGYPVVMGGVDEATVFDTQVGACPYSWIKPGVDFSHIVMATGLGASDELLFRDTANVDPKGVLRPGPRTYKWERLRMTTATALVPSWLSYPTGL